MGVKWNVGGEWDFCFDDDQAGIQKGWFRHKPIESKTIKLPHVWGKEKDYTHQSVAYYYKTFEVDKAESSKRFFIQFDSIHHYAQVWLNGEMVGNHLGGHIPFRLDGSKFVKIGESNLLVVRVEGPNETGQLVDRSASELPLGAIYKKSPFSGILGDIHFLMGGRAGIRAINCFPDFEADRVTIETKFWNPKNYKAELEITLTAPDGTTGTLPKFKKLEKENGTYTITLNIDKAQVWDLDDPKLYTVKVNLRGSYPMEVKFGLRRTEIERCMLKLNHEIIKVKGVQFLQIFPYLSALPPMEYNLRQDLERVKEAGFNVIRSGGVPFDHDILNICDEIGLLVIQESTCYNQKSNKDSLEELKDLLEGMMNSFGYHPSIIMWGIGSENGSMALENGNKLLRYCSEIDPYRPIVSNFNSVHLDSVSSGKIDLGKIYNPTETKIESFESHYMKINTPVPVSTQNLLVNYGTSKEAKSVNDGIHGGKSFWERYNYMKDELGGKILFDGLGMGVPSDLDNIISHPISKKHTQKSEYKEMVTFNTELKTAIEELSLFKDVESFYKEAEEICNKGLSKQIESLAMNSQISGYFFDSWCDQGNKPFGLVNKFREPKPLLEIVKKLNEKIKIMSEAENRTPYQGTSAAIKIFILNDDYLKEYGLLVRVKGPNGRIWHQEMMPGKAKAGLNSIGRFKFPVGTEPGDFIFDLSLTEGKKEIARKEESFLVPPKVELDDVLKKVALKGDFPKTLTYAQNPEAKLTIVNNIEQLDTGEIRNLITQVKLGKNLVFGPLNPEDADKLNQTEILPFKFNLIKVGGAGQGTYHYVHKSKEFKNLPSNGLMGEAYADILPRYSLTDISETNIISGSINLNLENTQSEKVKMGINCASIALEKGQIIFYQMDIFSKLGQNALADYLFANLVEVYSE